MLKDARLSDYVPRDRIMDYGKKITPFRHSGGRLKPDRVGLDEACESNRGRILNSAAVRRLQQKTQVFPLETNAAVRSRLTHSLEVMQTGRYIARSILKSLLEDGREDCGLAGMREAFVTTVEMACLLHDVGNPPFGHFGEEAINIWMREHASETLAHATDADLSSDLCQMILSDVTVFEGNAQAIRIVKSLQRLNLTLSQVAAILKYTRGAWQPKPEKSDPLYQLRKKPGFYLSERDYVSALQSHLDQREGARFPLTYIMEAADDISYCIADLDDAIDKNLMSMDRLLRSLRQKLEAKDALGPELSKLLEGIEKDQKRDDFDYGVHFRTRLVNQLVQQAAHCYVAHHQAIFDGHFERSLVEGGGEFDQALIALKEIAREQVFTRREVETLELKGMAAIRGLLDCHKGLMSMRETDFVHMLEGGFVAGRSLELRLVHRLPGKYKQAYLRHIHALSSKLSDEEKALWEWYYRMRLVLDHISGMTDTFAIEEYQTLYAIA